LELLELVEQAAVMVCVFGAGVIVRLEMTVDVTAGAVWTTVDVTAGAV